jgi:hypothetical protein
LFQITEKKPPFFEKLFKKISQSLKNPHFNEKSLNSIEDLKISSRSLIILEKASDFLLKPPFLGKYHP